MKQLIFSLHPLLKKLMKVYEITLPSPQYLKARIMEPEEVTIARCSVSNHVPSAMITQATIKELLAAVFSCSPYCIKYSVYSERKAGDRFSKNSLIHLCATAQKILF
jgi:hypothetical protein